MNGVPCAGVRVQSTSPPGGGVLFVPHPGKHPLESGDAEAQSGPGGAGPVVDEARRGAAARAEHRRLPQQHRVLGAAGEGQREVPRSGALTALQFSEICTTNMQKRDTR